MADRIREMTRDDSLEETVRKFAERGIHVSKNAVSKWKKGGGIGEPLLIHLCAIYGKKPEWVRYGIDNRQLSSEQKRIIDETDGLSIAEQRSVRIMAQSLKKRDTGGDSVPDSGYG
jgi:hypothetical protein